MNAIATGTDPILEIDGLRTEFRLRSGTIIAVNDLDLVIRPGETVALVGESGSGKSVTAMSILKLLPPSATVGGSVQWQGENLREGAGEGEE